MLTNFMKCLNKICGFEVCDDCSVANARQKSTNKVWTGLRQNTGESLDLDNISIEER